MPWWLFLWHLKQKTMPVRLGAPQDCSLACWLRSSPSCQRHISSLSRLSETGFGFGVGVRVGLVVLPHYSSLHWGFSSAQNPPWGYRGWHQRIASSCAHRIFTITQKCFSCWETWLLKAFSLQSFTIPDGEGWLVVVVGRDKKKLWCFVPPHFSFPNSEKRKEKREIGIWRKKSLKLKLQKLSCRSTLQDLSAEQNIFMIFFHLRNELSASVEDIKVQRVQNSSLYFP